MMMIPECSESNESDYYFIISCSVFCRINMGCCCARMEERVNEKFAESQIILREMCWANLRYQRSTGCCQIQGNGALVLTPDVLWFSLLCITKEIEMPLRHIHSLGGGYVNTPGQYGARDPGLIIDYVDPTSGIEDQVIISVPNPNHWMTLINDAINKAIRS